MCRALKKNCFLPLLYGLLVPTAWAAPHYELTNLGAYLPPNIGSVAMAINNQGQIVVSSAENSTGANAYLWQANGVIKIGSHQSTFNAIDVNELGQVVGTGGGLPGFGAYRWDQATGLTFLRPLGSYAGGSESVAMGINNLGQVAGRTTGVYEPYGAAWWDVDRSIHALDRWGGLSQANDINDNGTVVGWRQEWRQGTPWRTGFVWNETAGFTDIGTFGGESVAAGITDEGLVYGYSSSIDGTSRPFVWTEAGGLIQLPMPDYSSGHAGGANNDGQVVGSLIIEGLTRAALWDGDNFFDLNSLVNLDLGWTLTQATDINDSGMIVGKASNGTSNYAFLLTPVIQVPEPATYTIMLAGLGLVSFMARRRKQIS